ncbi:cupin [Actinocorallia libanotica]|uniref:Cupin domain-containing protein n=1 Tax=Actinocorallia libanotica TaxID=46162 RepID=A0ABP4CFG3_9ACTN
MTDLKSLAERHLSQAKDDKNGRSAHMFLHEGPLRQTVIALTAGSRLDEHNSPHAASLQVLSGRVVLTSALGDTELGEGELAPIPPERHGLNALADSVLVLTTVKG